MNGSHKINRSSTQVTNYQATMGGRKLRLSETREALVIVAIYEFIAHLLEMKSVMKKTVEVSEESEITPIIWLIQSS